MKMHDKHGPLVWTGKHLGMFVDQVQVRARYAVSDQPMSAEEWRKQYGQTRPLSGLFQLLLQGLH